MELIYDNVDYIQIIQTLKNENEWYDDSNIIKICEHEDDVIKIIELLNQKKMFQKYLKEDLAELNKINPCIEPGKYHMLCIYTTRYNKYINQIENKILWYEWKRFHKQNKKISGIWYWSWYLMSYFQYIEKKNDENCSIIEKNITEKKND